MASHDISWVPSTHVHFGDLDFVVLAEGELARAPIVVQPLHSASLDVITEMLEELRLHAPEAHALESGQLLNFDYGRLEHQLGVFLGPQLSQEDLCHLTSHSPIAWHNLLGESCCPWNTSSGAPR